MHTNILHFIYLTKMMYCTELHVLFVLEIEIRVYSKSCTGCTNKQGNKETNAILSCQQVMIKLRLIKYRFTHQGWDCKDDPKLKIWLFEAWLLISTFNWIFLWFTEWLNTEISHFLSYKELWMQEKEWKKIPYNRLLKFHLLWITLYIWCKRLFCYSAKHCLICL